MDRPPRERGPQRGESQNGHALNGQALHGQALHGQALHGQGQNGHVPNGHSAEGGKNGNSAGPMVPPGIPVNISGVQIAQGTARPGPVCVVCPFRTTCRTICEVIEALLPSPERGRVDSEDLPRLYAGIGMRRALLDWAHILTPRQQEVVRLYYRQSMMQNEIAEHLGVSQQAVHDSLRRARQTIGQQILHGSGTTRGQGLPGGRSSRRLDS